MSGARGAAPRSACWALRSLSARVLCCAQHAGLLPLSALLTRRPLLSPAARRGAPVEALAILGLLGSLVGIYSLPGAFVVCLVVPAQYYFGFRIIKNKVANTHNVNQRFSIVQEVLPAMKLLKYYAWERFFESEVREPPRRGPSPERWLPPLPAAAGLRRRCCTTPAAAPRSSLGRLPGEAHRARHPHAAR